MSSISWYTSEKLQSLEHIQALTKQYTNRILKGYRKPTQEALTWFRNELGRRVGGKP